MEQIELKGLINRATWRDHFTSRRLSNRRRPRCRFPLSKRVSTRITCTLLKKTNFVAAASRWFIKILVDCLTALSKKPGRAFITETVAICGELLAINWTLQFFHEYMTVRRARVCEERALLLKRNNLVQRVRLHGNGLINKTTRFEYWLGFFLFPPLYACVPFFLYILSIGKK